MLHVTVILAASFARGLIFDKWLTWMEDLQETWMTTVVHGAFRGPG